MKTVIFLYLYMKLIIEREKMMLQKNLEHQQQEECYYREGLTQKEMDQFQVNMDGLKELPLINKSTVS